MPLTSTQAATDDLVRTLHHLLCVPGSRPDAVWSEGHRRTDRTRGEAVARRMRELGWKLTRADPDEPAELVAFVSPLAEDFLA